MLNKDFTRSMSISTRSSSAHVEESRRKHWGREWIRAVFLIQNRGREGKALLLDGSVSSALRKVNFVYEDQPLAVKELELNKL